MSANGFCLEGEKKIVSEQKLLGNNFQKLTNLKKSPSLKQSFKISGGLRGAKRTIRERKIGVSIG